MGTVNENSSYSPVGPWVCLFVFLGCMICLYVGVCFVLSWTVESLPFMFGAGVTNLNEPRSSFLLLRVRSWLHSFKGHCEQKAMRDEGVMSLVIHYWIGDVHDSRLWEFPKCKAQYSLIVLKVPLNSNQSINLPLPLYECHFLHTNRLRNDLFCVGWDVNPYSLTPLCLSRTLYVCIYVFAFSFSVYSSF